jgi:hypothetical protein
MVNKNCDLLGEVMAMVIWHILLHTSIIAIIQTLFITTGSPPDSLIWGHGNWACKCSKKKELPMCWQKKHAWMARSTPSVACIYICQDWGSFERLDKQQVPQMALTSAVPVLQNKLGPHLLPSEKICNQWAVFPSAPIHVELALQGAKQVITCSEKKDHIRINKIEGS